MLRVLVLSEDRSKDAHATITALAKKIFRLVDDRCQTQHIEFEPADDVPPEILAANKWKSAKGRDHRNVVALIRTMATKLSEKHGLVLFHVDGDGPWSKRESSENASKFQERITAKVRALLESKRSEWSAEDIDERMERLCLLMPFYSIEAWLYQNTAAASQLCQKHYRGQDMDKLATWAADRGLLDELDQPKKHLCFGSKHNCELAETAFPHQDVHAAGKSFAAVVDRLGRSMAVLAALELTWQR